jgi:hypothetical protein
MHVMELSSVSSVGLTFLAARPNIHAIATPSQFIGQTILHYRIIEKLGAMDMRRGHASFRHGLQCFNPLRRALTASFCSNRRSAARTPGSRDPKESMSHTVRVNVEYGDLVGRVV